MSHGPDIDDTADHAATTTAAAPAVRAADARAATNIRKNLAALTISQPAVAAIAQADPTTLTWMFGRDGALTAQSPDGRWWGNCSVPAAAAAVLLKSFKPQGTLQCYLSPTHAAEVRIALDMAGPVRGIAAIVPDPQTLCVILHGGDFSDAIAAGRLFLAAGPDWVGHLQAVFEDRPGLPIPVQFIRTALLVEEAGRPLIDAAQELFGRVTVRRGEIIQSVQNRATIAAALPPEFAAATARGTRMCVVASSQIRLWSLAGAALRVALVDSIAPSPAEQIICVDPDSPTSASPLALAIAAEKCDVVVCADTARSDLPNLVSPGTAWITFVTGPRIPAPPPPGQSPRDGLLLADASWLEEALAAGWPRDRLVIAAWPQVVPASCPPEKRIERPALAMLADVTDLAPPSDLDKFSSQKLLWEAIADELTRDPLAADEDPGIYLNRSRARLSISPDNLDHRLFIEQLILPAYAVGLARRLLAAGYPLALFGSGWDTLTEFAANARGPITSTADLARAATSASALVHAWPSTWSHPIDALGPVVIRRRGREMEPILSAAKRALRDPPSSRSRATNSPRHPPLDWASVLRLAGRNGDKASFRD